MDKITESGENEAAAGSFGSYFTGAMVLELAAVTLGLWLTSAAFDYFNVEVV
jgi:hypothetical protein